MCSLSFIQRAAFCLFLAWGEQTFADECPRASARGVAGQSDQQRLAFLSAQARDEAAAIGTWKLLSGATFALLVMGQLAIAPLFEPSERPDYYWGAGYSALGLASTLVPAPVVFERGQAFAKEAAEATDENRCRLIAEGERLLEQSAATEALTTQWYLHVLNVAVNVSLGAILGFGYGHWRNAAINTVVGIALSETVLFTKPRGLVKAWRAYAQGGDEPVTLGLRLGRTFDGGLSVGVGGTF